MRTLVGMWRLARALLHLLHGMVVMAIRFRSLDAAGRQRWIQSWSARLLRVLGIDVQASGAPRSGATLVVANHVSWLDIAAIHATAPQARFVSRADVRHWPFVGWLAAGAGTLFIERASKRDALRVVHQVADALRAGDMVAVFPEGTTGAGPALLPFHANLLQAAIATDTPVQPVVLRFHQPGHAFSGAIEFVGQTSLVQSVWRVVCARGLCVRLDWLAPQGSAQADRRRLAATLRDTMAVALLRSAAATARDIPLADNGACA